MLCDKVDDDCDDPILSEEARLGLWASEGGYVPPLLDETANGIVKCKPDQ
jgi:hypothetical protein